jgi:L-2-hydroxyglutarate oxidase LhgO
MEEVDCIVVGAGVIGLAIARALALAGREVVIVEQANRIGAETSSRNSEVIHAGLYYEKGSLMARLCVEGRRLLYHFCAAHGVGHRRCGKLVVATAPDDVARLEAIRTRVARNGVDDLVVLSASEARALEPALHCEAALLSPSTGIIDSHGYMLALLAEAEAYGATLVLNTPLIAAAVKATGLVAHFSGASPTRLRCRMLVNAAGLHAPDLARRIEGFSPSRAPQAFFAKGNYFALSGRAPFSRLIYPTPVAGGLGAHLTLDLSGQARFGPDVEWIETIDYGVNPARAEDFYAAIRRWWPDLKDGQLAPAYAGIRPKIVPPGAGPQDFLIQGPRDHGVAGLINLFGIESPGLTASLALAAHVAALAREG